jgi:5-methylcytosine-specific restriction endonuclease McrA
MSETTALVMQSSSQFAFPTDQLARDVWDGMWANPWLSVLVALLVVRASVRSVRNLVHSVHARDAVRTFSRADKTTILTRAGGRCEHHSWLGGRCDQTLGLEADHVHPHSRGGWTDLANGQALCRRHNKAKGARVPWGWELNRLSRHRTNYFAPGTPTQVARHRPRRTASV